MRESRRLKKKLIALKALSWFFVVAGWLSLAYGGWAATNHGDFIHSKLDFVFAYGIPSWSDHLIDFMTFGVYGCLMYILLGVGKAIDFRLHHHKWREIIEGKKW